MRLPVNYALPVALIAVIASGAAAYAKNQPASSPPVNGPAADYPVVVGAPFQVGGVTYTPEDKLNYDAVGYARVGTQGGTAISAAHKTLPLPSYAEVTSLDSGKTILVRVERRGPLVNDRLIELSPGAAAQLGLVAQEGPIRVRRVNPPEQERALLRAGQHAPERMDTPRGLLDALNRKLLGNTATRPLAVPTAAPTPVPSAGPSPKPTRPALRPSPAPQPVAAPSPKPAAALPTSPVARPTLTTAVTPRPAASGGQIVQVGTFSAQDRASGVATKLGGHVSRFGRFWRVRMGPFTARAEADAALAKAKAAGYSDARIQRAD